MQLMRCPGISVHVVLACVCLDRQGAAMEAAGTTGDVGVETGLLG